MPRGTVVIERFRRNQRASVSKGIVRAGDWIINHKGLIRKVAEGSTVSEEWNWPATVDDGFRLAKLPKPEGSIIANVYGELCAMRDDGIIIGHQNLLTRFRVKTFITGEGAKTFWHKDGTVNRDKVIDISRLPLSDAIPLLPECVLTRLRLVSEQKPLDDKPAEEMQAVSLEELKIDVWEAALFKGEAMDAAHKFDKALNAYREAVVKDELTKIATLHWMPLPEPPTEDR